MEIGIENFQHFVLSQCVQCPVYHVHMLELVCDDGDFIHCWVHWFGSLTLIDDTMTNRISMCSTYDDSTMMISMLESDVDVYMITAEVELPINTPLCVSDMEM